VEFCLVIPRKKFQNARRPLVVAKDGHSDRPVPLAQRGLQAAQQGQVDLGPDGGYKASLFAGEYQVVVTPPYMVDHSSGMPNPYYKKVKNIPKKYHSTATSGLTARVAADKTTHDFDLTP
jgi:hypothetical protein